MLNTSSEEDSFLKESVTVEDICSKGELRKEDISSITEPAKKWGEEYSKRDEDSDESTLLDPASGASVSLQSTLEDIEEARRGVGDPDDPCPQRPRYCTGCSPLRILMSPMAVLVLGLVGMTYYAYVIETSDASILELLLFHVLIALLLGCASHISSPTSPCPEFHRASPATSHRHRGGAAQLCRKEGGGGGQHRCTRHGRKERKDCGTGTTELQPTLAHLSPPQPATARRSPQLSCNQSGTARQRAHPAVIAAGAARPPGRAHTHTCKRVRANTHAHQVVPAVHAPRSRHGPRGLAPRRVRVARPRQVQGCNDEYYCYRDVGLFV
jgi:hypothetical protein